VRVPRLPESPLRLRGFTGPLTHVPFLYRALRHGSYDVAHAFSAPDAKAALAWARRTGGPAVFTCVETLTRESLADRRLRLRLLTAAVERSDAVIAPSVDAVAALRRWMATDALLLEPADATAHERLYRKLLQRPYM
jgi:hypothetical protein